MNFSIRRSDSTTYVEAQGDIVAGVGRDLEALAGKIEDKRVILDLGRVRTMNSVGCGEWSRAIKPLASAFLIEFSHCPIAFVDYCNMIPSMLGAQGLGGSVLIKSFYAPYACRDCREEFKMLIELTDVQKSKKLALQPCPRCQEPVKPEVESEDYLAFLDRTL